MAGPTQKGISIPRVLHEEVARIVAEDPVLYSTVADFVVTATREEIRRFRREHPTPTG